MLEVQVIQPLNDQESYRRKRDQNWKRNTDYWLSQPLRHVVDVGEHIVHRVTDICQRNALRRPTILDMGCGNCWLLDAIIAQNLSVQYIGVDANPEFITFAQSRYANVADARFILADIERVTQLDVRADIVVNAFNFFEVSDLLVAMQNVHAWLREGGTLFMSTIDKTFLILALSTGWESFLDNLRKYQTESGTKYDFQRIDLGDGVSENLEYPSVLYNTQNFIDSARANGLSFRSYEEQAFTARPIPKIYCHLEFTKERS